MINNQVAFQLKSLPICLSQTLKLICPNLYNIEGFADNHLKELFINFYFDDDPMKDDKDYLGHSLREFQKDSLTRKQLELIDEILYYVFVESKVTSNVN